MTDNVTPMEMLREYRRHAPAFDSEQAEMFKAMSGNDKTELLFRMLLQANAGLRMLHERLDGPQPLRGREFITPTQ